MKAYEQVFSLLTKRLASLGFERRGSSWLQIQRGRIWRRIHIHKFRAGDYFRVHAALHAVGFEDEAPWLNGPMSHDGWFEEAKGGMRRYDFSFEDTAESLSACADELRAYIEDCVMPWFDSWGEERELLEAPNSPLTAEAKAFLRKEPNRPSQRRPSGGVADRNVDLGE
jgi:hypothetical protein